MKTPANTKKARRRILLDCGTNEVEFLRFDLANNRFGINVAKIQQVLVFDQDKITRVPKSETYLSGNLLYRGECVPIVSLRAYFGEADFHGDYPELLLLCEFNDTYIGFRVDRVTDILRCSWDNFVATEASSDQNRESCQSGTVIWDDEMTPILDVEEILVRVKPDAAILRDMPLVESQIQSESIKKTILYCEDSKTVQKALIQALHKRGYLDLKVFPSGLDGLDFLKANPQQSIDLIISDIEMPRMDGLTLCKEIRQVDGREKVPFFFFSSTISEEMREKCRSVGGDAAFTKPEIIEMTKQIDSLFSIQRS